nr:DUF1345 domain-containing protein [uncultured Chitinophaga sp.]
MAKRRKLKDVIRLYPLQRSMISLGLTAFVWMILEMCHVPISPLVLSVLLWDVFALSYISIAWLVFVWRKVPEIRAWAREDDGGRTFVTIFLLVSSFASMIIVALLMVSDEPEKPGIYLPVAIVGILSSWALVHTTYSFHYAHLFYDDDVNDSSRHAGGLDFPQEKYPDYVDFAYFSFVIGMTFQVSDVEIGSRAIRRTVLIHGLLSYLLNTFVMALTINLIAGLIHR